MFKRRERGPWVSRVREAVYPRRGWARSVEYLRHRVSRLPDTPHRIALGFACGVIVSFTPFFGLHFFLAAGLAWLLRANVVAGLIGTVAGNPLTFPFIASVSLHTGRRVLGSGVTGRDYGRVIDALAEGGQGLWENVLSLFGIGASHWDRLTPLFTDVVLPWTIGGLPPGFLAAAASYWLLRPLIAAYQARRRSRMRTRARETDEDRAGASER